MPVDQQSRPSRASESMSILVDMATAALDPEYRDAHARRTGTATSHREEADERAPGERRTRWRGLPFVLTAALLAAGLITGVAAAQVRQEQKQASALRLSLVGEVRRQTAATDALARQEGSLRREVAALRSQGLGQDSQGRTLADRLGQLELAAGAVAVVGPGLVVTLDDAARPASDGPGGSGDSAEARGDGRIYDRDLQDITNALWTAGAEEISINDQRLTAQTSIRSAGEAVLVDFRPLNPPYTLRAVGPVDTMEPRLVDGQVARRFQTWTSLYGITFRVARARELRLPAAGPANLRHVLLAPDLP